MYVCMYVCSKIDKMCTVNLPGGAKNPTFRTEFLHQGKFERRDMNERWQSFVYFKFNKTDCNWCGTQGHVSIVPQYEVVEEMV